MSLRQNYRLINIDRLDPDASANFDLSTLVPADTGATASIGSSAEVQALAGQIRQLLRAGDAEGALRGALESVPYGADDRAKEVHLATVTEILQSIKQSEMTPLLSNVYRSERGSEMLDVLMKYLYKGMQHTPHQSGASTGRKSISPQPTGFSQIHARGAAEGGGAAMSVLLSWHEKLVEVAGPGSVVRVMTDRRTV